MVKYLGHLPGGLKSISEIKILGHSMLINADEAEEIEAWANTYLENIKAAIVNEKWDDLQPPNPEDGIVKKYVDKLKGFMPSTLSQRL